MCRKFRFSISPVYVAYSFLAADTSVCVAPPALINLLRDTHTLTHMRTLINYTRTHWACHVCMYCNTYTMTGVITVQLL